MKQGITFLAMAAALFMQTGLCPMCVVGNCAVDSESAYQTAGATESPSSCCAHDSASEQHLAEPDSSTCQSCGSKCEGQCFTVESDINLPAATSMKLMGHDAGEELPAMSHTVTEATAFIPADCADSPDLPPPDDLSGKRTAELLL